MSQDKSRNIDRIIQVVLGVIGAAATIYAGYQATTIINITEANAAIVETATQERLEAIQAPTQTPFYITQLVEVTRIFEITATERPFTPTPEITVTPSPSPATIVVNYEGRTNADDVVVVISTIELTSNNVMRWNISFWNKTKDYTTLRLDLKNCAYVSNRDNGEVYSFIDSSFTNGEKITISPNAKVDYWFDFEDGISKGARNLTIGICPNFYAGFSFATYDLTINK